MNSFEYFKFNINGISRNDIDAAYFLMSPERKEKCDRFRVEKEKIVCIAADMLLRKLLSERTGLSQNEIRFYEGNNGKPYLSDLSYFFNISHAGDYIAIALCKDAEIGIDIEKIRPVRHRLLSHFCTDSDMDFIFGDKKELFSDEVIEDREILTRVFRVWTYKEAYVKSIGESILEYAKMISYDEGNCVETRFKEYRQCIVVRD